MREIFYAVLAPITTAFQALEITLLLPWFLVPALISLAIFTVWGLKKKESIDWAFCWNLLPFLIIWPVVGLSFTAWAEKERHLHVLDDVMWPYFALALVSVFLARRAGFMSLAAQSLIFIYALGEYVLCGMAITGKWL